MSDGNWRVPAAFGIVFGGLFSVFLLILVLGLNYCPEAPCDQEAGNQEQPSNNEDWLPTPPWTNSAPDPHPANDYEHAKYYEHQDLQAQTDMAQATNWIVWLSFGSIVLGIAGTIALVWTIVETRRAVTVTRESSRDETRAYVHIKTIKVRHLFDDEQGDWWADCLFYVENSGSTPCKRFEIEGGAICSTDKPIFDALPARLEEPKGWSALPSNEVFTARVRFSLIGFQEIEQKYFMHVGGVVRYTTFFEEVFETEFSFMLRSDFWKDAATPDERMKMSRTTFNIQSYKKVS